MRASSHCLISFKFMHLNQVVQAQRSPPSLCLPLLGVLVCPEVPFPGLHRACPPVTYGHLHC